MTPRTVSTVRPSDRGPGRRVGAYAKRAAWELLVALPDEGFDEGNGGREGRTRDAGVPVELLEGLSHHPRRFKRRFFFFFFFVVAPVRRASSWRAATRYPRSPGASARTRDVARGARRAPRLRRRLPRRPASRAAGLMTSNNFDSPDGERSDARVAYDPKPRRASRGGRTAGTWATLAALCASLSRATRRWTDAALNTATSALAPAESKALAMVARGAVRQDERRAEPDSSGLAADAGAQIADGTGEGELRREALSRRRAASEAALHAEKLEVEPVIWPMSVLIRTNLQTPSDTDGLLDRRNAFGRRVRRRPVLGDDGTSPSRISRRRLPPGRGVPATRCTRRSIPPAPPFYDGRTRSTWSSGGTLRGGLRRRRRASRPSRATRRRSSSGTSRACAAGNWRGSRTRRRRSVVVDVVQERV